MITLANGPAQYSVPRKMERSAKDSEVFVSGEDLVMANNLNRYGIMIHRKGSSYEDDYWFRDNKRFMIREFSHDAADAVLKILKHQYGDGYSFRVRRLD